MKKIPLGGKNARGLFAIVDDIDFDILSRFKWYLKNSRGKSYAATTLWSKSDNYKTPRTVFLHLAILWKPLHMVVDHENGDGLDNRRANLKIKTISGNSLNRKDLCKGNKSGVSGVNWNKNHAKWNAAVRFQNKRFHLGFFTHLEDAAWAVVNFELPKN